MILSDLKPGSGERDVDVVDNVNRLKKKEDSEHYKCSDYLVFNEDEKKNKRQLVNESCRSQMCTWCYNVGEFYKFQRETVAVALYNLDRFMSTKQGHMVLSSRSHYQLAAIATLYTTAKILETSTIESSLLAKLSQGSFQEKDVATMELIILNALGWRMIAPTPLAFLTEFINLLPADSIQDVSHVKERMLSVAQRQVELAISEYYFVTYKRSDIALAAVLNAMDDISTDVLSSRSREQFRSSLKQCCSGFKKNIDDVNDTQKILNLLYLGLDCKINSDAIDTAIDTATDVREDKLIDTKGAESTPTRSKSISCQESPVSTVREDIS